MRIHKAKVAAAVFGLLALATALAQTTTGRGRATLPMCAASVSNPQGFAEGDIVLLNHKAGTREPGLYVCRRGTWMAMASRSVGFEQLDVNLKTQIGGSADASQTTLGGTTLSLYDNNGGQTNVEFNALLRQIGPTTVRDKLQTLSGANRLDASAVKNLPDGQVISDGTLDGSGTSASPLEVANPFTGADEGLLDFVGNLRKATTLGTVNLAQNVGDSIGPGNITNIALPSANEGDVVSITVTGERTGAASFPLATLLAKTTASSGTTVGPANSITFADNAGDDIHVLRTATHFIFVLDGPGTATVAVMRLAFDVANFARPSSGVEVQRNDLAAHQRIPAISDGQALFGNSNGILVARTARDTDLAGLPTTASKSAASAGAHLVLNAGKTGYELQVPRVLPTPFTTGKPLVATSATAAAWQDVSWAAVSGKPVATQAQAESGLGTTPLLWSQQRIAQAVAARETIEGVPLYSNPKGRLIATSGALPTDTASQTTDYLNPGWTLDSAVTAHYSSGVRYVFANPGLPSLDTQVGFVVEAEVNGTATDRCFLLWGPSNGGNRPHQIDTMLNPSTTTDIWVSMRVSSDARHMIGVRRAVPAEAYPANTVLKVYEWVDSGGAIADTDASRSAFATVMNKASTDAMRFDYATALKNAPPAAVAQASGNTFPTNPMNGEKFDLLADVDSPQWAKLTLGADTTRVGWTSNTNGSDLVGVSNVRLPGVRTIARGIGGIGANLLNRVYVTVANGNSKTPSKLLVHNATTGTNAAYALTAVPATTSFYRTATNPIAPAWASGDVVYANIDYSDGTKELPNLDKKPHIYAFNAESQAWQEAFGLHTYAEIDAHVRSDVLMDFADRANFARPDAQKSLIPRILLPRSILIGRATDQQLAYLRNAGDNTWTDPNALSNTQIGGIKKGALPAGAECYFILQIPSRTGQVWSDRFHCDEFRSFPDATWDRALTSSAVRVRREIMSSQDALFSPAADRSSYRATLRGQVVLWLGWKACGSETCLVARSDHAAYWVAGSTIELWAAPLG